MGIEEAKKVLREAGYYVDNLWCVDDIRNNLSYDEDRPISDEVCLELLGASIADSYACEQGYDYISYELDSYYKK